MTMKYWVCINNEILGPLEPAQLSGIKGFSVMVWACPDDGGNGPGERQWKRAISFPELAACFFPDYPKAAQAPQKGVSFEASPPGTAEGGAPPVPPPPSPEDAAMIAQINKKLDQLLRVPAAKQTVPAGVEPLNKNLYAIGQAMEAIRARVALQDTRIHDEIAPLGQKLDQAGLVMGAIKEQLRQGVPVPSSNEPLARSLNAIGKAMAEIRDSVAREDSRLQAEFGPLNRKLDQAEREIAELHEQLRSQAAPASMEPLSAKLDLAENTLEGLKGAMEKQDAELHSGFEPISARVALAEKAIEEENGIQRTLVEKISLLDRDVSGLREDLKNKPAPAAARSHPARISLVTIVLAGAGVLALYRFTGWALTQAAQQVEFTAPKKQVKPVKASAWADPVLFVKNFGSAALPLGEAIMLDAAARGAAPGAISWSVETGSDGLPRAIGEAARPGGRAPFYYYFSVNIPGGRVVPLNRSSRRVLDKVRPK